MIRGWLAKHRSLVVTSTSVLVIAALVTTVAIVSGGYKAQHLELGDASVWVSNGEEQVIGRANTEILQLNTVVPATGSDLDVVQSGATVLLLDRANTRVDIVDPASSTVIDSAALPTDSPEIFLAGVNVVIFAAGTGEVWIVPQSQLADFDAAAEATLSLGRNSAVAVTPEGILHAFSADTRQLFRVDATNAIAASETLSVDFGGAGADVDLSVAGGRPVLFDRQNRELWVDGTVVALDGTIAAGAQAALQLPSAVGGSVLLAHEQGLLSVSLDGGAIEQLDGDRSGSPARPWTTGECSFAAWADGTAWRQCGDRDAETFDLVGMDSSAAGLIFQGNGDRVVLNDPRTGRTWAVQQRGELIDNWDELVSLQDDQEQLEQDNPDAPPEYEKDQLPPVAVDDDFGARPGRATLLPVLLNDYDPNGDALVISDITAIDEAQGRVEAVAERQQVQLSLSDTASGVITFGYTITDGRGGSASATVRVTVRAPHENSAPVQVRQSRAVVGQNERVTTPVLGDWVDPDGDAFYLSSATVAAPDAVSHKPEGLVVFQEGGGSGVSRSVALVVSDGTSEASGSLEVSVSAPGEVPIIADIFAVSTFAGNEIKISPLAHVRGGSGPLRLSSVPAKTGSTIKPNYEKGTFRFSSDEIRTFYVDYVVTDGDQSVTAQVRIDVTPPPDANSRPITTPKTVFVKTLSSETLDVAAMDVDPAGGVLMVTGIAALDPASGVRAEVLEQRSIRITLVAPLDHGPVTLSYRISNGLSESVGVVTVIEIPQPERMQAPVATDDSVTVRVGDTIDIPVLANDLHPDGEDLRLNPTLASDLGSGSGLLFASGDRLRYLAPMQTGNFSAVYEIIGPDGQTAQAQLRIAVREVVAASNNAPVPVTVVARVIAGEKVSIRIPLTGIDPDGDSVQLLGQESNPEKGAVTQVGADYIEYEAGSYSAGTDEFSYTVIDALGARATGKVRVGISPPQEGARNPVAVADEVRTRPGGTIAVQVLANDSDPDGSELSVVSVVPNGSETVATIVDNIVEVTPPTAAGRYGLVYTIENEFGGTSSNFLTVIVDPDAPRPYPVAADTVLTLSDILGRESVTVNVLNNVFFADGPVSKLRLSLLDGYRSSAQIVSGKRIEVTIGQRSQIIPFAVANPDDSTIVAYAFIRVPGLDDALPQLDKRAPALSVASESRLVIKLNDYVVAVGGKQVRLSDTTTVQATHSNGESLVLDSETLVFTSADKYFGPASISFEVTDGASASAADAQTATLVLPIRVTPRENQPPVFTGGSIEFEPGEERVLELLKLTTYPYPDDLDELAFTGLDPLPTGFSYTLRGSTLTLRADADAPKGTSTSLSIGVRDDLSAGQPGTISLKVVASSRPLARPAPDTAITPRGKSTVIDVLANDSATNPFPGTPLKVVAIRGIGGGELPAGISVVPSADKSRLTVTVAENAQPIDTQLQYQVADATNDPDRFVWGTATISVQDVPDAPIAPSRVSGHSNGSLTLKIIPPVFNNSAITKYEVVGSGNGGTSYRKDCGLQQLCTLDDLTVGASYEFRVIATNAIGPSAPGAATSPLRVDYLPAAPATVTATPTTAANSPRPGFAVSWSAVSNPQPGTAVTGYTVRISGPGIGKKDIVMGLGTSLVINDALIQAGQQYEISVTARNSAQVDTEEWNRAFASPLTAIGPPSPAGAVSAAVINPQGHIRLSWSASDWAGAASGGYRVERFTVGESHPDVCNPGAAAQASGWVDDTAVDGEKYFYAVYASNTNFCTVAVSGDVETKKAPGQASTALAVAERPGGSGVFDVKITALSAAAASAASPAPARYEYRIGSGAWKPAVLEQFVTSAADSSVYGTVVDVSVRACRDASADFCGPESAAATAIPIATRAGVLACVVGSELEFVAPANGPSATVVGYQLEYLLAGVVVSPFAPWAPGDTVMAGVDTVRVKATVSDGTTTYQDPGFGVQSCS